MWNKKSSIYQVVIFISAEAERIEYFQPRVIHIAQQSQKAVIDISKCNLSFIKIATSVIYISDQLHNTVIDISKFKLKFIMTSTSPIKEQRV